eukprot:TRINITY_DN522_c2_g1_i1.p1 TRINITY_DN522_c2_g1~~TRINITY_DN522_c2_g1_i1.p1  ORF type:complete len:281 (-),score=74.68 TRINITY_DN522_c2_g1_i1:2-844(-)
MAEASISSIFFNKSKAKKNDEVWNVFSDVKYDNPLPPKIEPLPEDSDGGDDNDGDEIDETSNEVEQMSDDDDDDDDSSEQEDTKQQKQKQQKQQQPEKKAPISNPKEDDKLRTVTVSKLPNEMSRSMVKELFSSFGEIEKFNWQKGNTRAFITFKRLRSAINALSANSAELAGGMHLKVKSYKSLSNTEGGKPKYKSSSANTGIDIKSIKNPEDKKRAQKKKSATQKRNKARNERKKNITQGVSPALSGPTKTISKKKSNKNKQQTKTKKLKPTKSTRFA